MLAKGYAEHQPEDTKKALNDAATQLQNATQNVIEKARNTILNPNSDVRMIHLFSHSYTHTHTHTLSL
jgi:hypothetical protein